MHKHTHTRNTHATHNLLTNGHTHYRERARTRSKSHLEAARLGAVTQNNIANPRSKPDSIGVGDWSLDEHMTGKFAVPIGGDKYEVRTSRTHAQSGTY